MLSNFETPCHNFEQGKLHSQLVLKDFGIQNVLCILYIIFIIFFTELVERVFFRLVLADTDEKFQTELNNFLPPVLLKIATKDEVVKNKVW